MTFAVPVRDTYSQLSALGTDKQQVRQSVSSLMRVRGREHLSGHIVRRRLPVPLMVPSEG